MNDKERLLRSKYQGLRTYNPYLLILLMLVTIPLMLPVRLAVGLSKAIPEGIDEIKEAVSIVVNYCYDYWTKTV